MRAPGRLAAFMYHEITDDPLSTGFQRLAARSYTRTVADFERHLDLVGSAGLAPALVSEVAPEAPADELLLTFDDGGRSARRAADALAMRGWRGHFFIVTGLVGRAGFVSDSDVRALVDGGHLVGSHSVSHPDIFRALTPDRMRREWRESRDALEQMTGAECRIASVPGGDLSAKVAVAAADSGISALFTSEPWLRPRRVGGCWLFGRFAIRRSLADDAFSDLVRGRGWHRALLRRRASVLARRSLDPLYRLYVRFATAGDRLPSAP